jgi:hypothetical protein
MSCRYGWLGNPRSCRRTEDKPGNNCAGRSKARASSSRSGRGRGLEPGASRSPTLRLHIEQPQERSLSVRKLGSSHRLSPDLQRFSNALLHELLHRPDWPCRDHGAKAGGAAIHTVLSYLPRYSKVAKLAELLIDRAAPPSGLAREPGPIRGECVIPNNPSEHRLRGTQMRDRTTE